MNLLTALRYLVALQEHRHFGRAAQACHITQPALSNALRAVEREFGVAVVRRARQFEGFTPEGERVLSAARRMLREHEALTQELASDALGPRGRLRLAAVPTAMPLLARFAARLRARHPGIVPQVLAMSSQALEDGLQALSVDLALGYLDRLPPDRAALAAWPQYTEHYHLLQADASAPALAAGPPLAWADAARMPLCLLTPDMHNRRIVDAAFERAGVAVQPAIETDSVLALALTVAAGGVASVLPGAVVAALRGQAGLRAHPLVAPVVQTPMGFIAHARQAPPRALQAALALAQDADWQREAAAHSGPQPVPGDSAA